MPPARWPRCQKVWQLGNELYNTLTGETQEFAPADGKTVKMYVCGVTPYSTTHVGHALRLRRFRCSAPVPGYMGYSVKHVQNFTDVDDKIIQRAQEQGIDPRRWPTSTLTTSTGPLTR